MKVFSVDNDDWSSLFRAMKMIADHSENIHSAFNHCFENELLGRDFILFGFSFSTEWKCSLNSLYTCLHELAQCCSGMEDLAVNRYYVFTLLKSVVHQLNDSSSLPNDVVKFIQSVVNDIIRIYFDDDLLCMDFFLTTSHSDVTSCQGSEYTRDDACRAFRRYYPDDSEYEECVKEFDSYVHRTDIDYSWEAITMFWKTDGKNMFPNLARIAEMALSYPCIKESFTTYSSIKTYIHYHVRSKKDGDGNSTKSSDEMMISCNRHLFMRWDLD